MPKLKIQFPSRHRYFSEWEYGTSDSSKHKFAVSVAELVAREILSDIEIDLGSCDNSLVITALDCNLQCRVKLSSLVSHIINDMDEHTLDPEDIERWSVAFEKQTKRLKNSAARGYKSRGCK